MVIAPTYGEIGEGRAASEVAEVIPVVAVLDVHGGQGGAVDEGADVAQVLTAADLSRFQSGCILSEEGVDGRLAAVVQLGVHNLGNERQHLENNRLPKVVGHQFNQL